MASIRRRKGSQFYHACITLPGGRRKQISTGLSDPDDARQFAIHLEKTGRRASQRQALPVKQAKKILNEIAAIFGGSLEDETISQAVYRITPMQNTGNARSDQRRKQVLEMFLAYLGERKNEPAAEIGPSDILGFRDQELKRGLSPNTVNVFLAYLSGLFSQLKLEEKVTSNPVDGTRIKGAKKQASKRKAFSLKQFEQLLEKTSGEWRSLILLAGLTGQRKEECLSLKWGDVDFKKSVISFTRTKNKDVHQVPIHPLLLKELQARVDLPGKRLFPKLSKLPKTGRESVSDLFRNEILPKIGIVQKYGGAKGDGRVTAEYAFHSLRHSLSTWLAEAGVSEDQRMQIIGHEDRAINRGYTHASAQSFASLLGKVAI
jgi:integrase